MIITTTITAETPEEWRDAILGLAASAGVAVTATPSPTAVPAPVAASAPASTPVVAPEPAPQAPAQEATPAITLDALRAKAVALAQAGKNAEIHAALQQHGVQRLPDLPAAKYDEFNAFLETL